MRSIQKHAPWIDTIWIVTNGQTADLSALPPALTAKIRYASHADLFEGLGDCLPTFNSLAIESVLWRIDGLAERFIYFNDDVFLTRPVSPGDFFTAEGVVLRGGWRDFSAMTPTSEYYHDPAYLFHFVQINAARMIGYTASNLFSTAHVAHPMQKSVFRELFRDYADEFTKNAGFRFRDSGQFLPQSLHNHACISASGAAFVEVKDHFHVYSYFGVGETEEKVRYDLEVGLQHAKFICVNDLPELEKIIPDIREWLDALVGE